MQTESRSGAPWVLVVGLSIDQLVAWGALYYSYSVLAVPMAHDLGLSTSAVAAAFSLSLLTSSLVGPRIGHKLDRDGARPVMLYGAVLGSLALSGLAAVHGGLPLLAVFAALGLAQALSLYEPAFRSISSDPALAAPDAASSAQS